MRSNVIGFRADLACLTRQRLPRTCRATLLVSVLLMVFSSAHADCIGGTRKRTAEELSFGRQVASHLQAALPAAPTSMWLEVAPEVLMDTATCRDTPVGAMGAAIRAVYQYRMPDDEARRVQARRDALGEQIRVLNTLPPELKTEFDALNAGYFAAIREAKQAEKTADRAVADRKYREADEFASKAKAVEQRHLTAVKAQYEALSRQIAALPSDRMRLELFVSANAFQKNSPDHLQITYRMDEKDRKDKSTAFRVRFVQATVSDVDGGGGVNVGGVNVRANQETLDALVTAIDRSRLQVLMQHPLPADAAPVAWRVGKPAENMAATAGAQSASGQAPGQPEGSSTSPSPTATPTQQAASPPSGKPDQPSPQPPAQPPTKQAAKTDEAAEKAKEVVNRLKGLLKF